MTALQNPETGSIIQATGRLETRLIGQGWTPTNQPPTPGLRIITAAELEQVTQSLTTAVAASQADRTDLRGILEPIAIQLPEVAAEVDQLTATVEATTTQQAPNPTPRTDALEAWRSQTEPVINGLHPVAVSGAYSDLGNRPTLGTMAPQGKSTVDITGGTITGITDLALGDGGTGASIPADARTNLGLKGAAVLDVGTTAGTVAAGNDTRLSDARTPTAHTHPAAQVTGLHLVATSGAYNDLTGKPSLSFDPAGSAATAQATAVQRANHTGTQAAATITGLHAVATSGDYNALTNKPVITTPTVVRLNADHAAFTTTSLVNVTGLSFPVVAGTYYRFRFDVIFRTPVLTTGAGFGLTIPAATVYAATVSIPFAADGAGASWIGFLTSSGDSVLSTGVQAINTDYLATIEGVILPSANGTVQLQAKTEVASSNLTVRNGSQLSY